MWRGNHPIAWGIQRFTKSPWSHCGWFLNENQILDSDWGLSRKTWGVQIRDAAPYMKYADDPSRMLIASLPMAEDDIEKALQKALSHVGKTGYDYWLFFNIGLQLIRGRRCCDDLREWKDAFICSEIIAKPCFEASGFRFVDDPFDIDSTTPHDVYLKTKT